jgi:DnaJ-class molecular chaperone
MSDRTRLSLTAEEREVLAHCVKSTIGLVQIAVGVGPGGKLVTDWPCPSCEGTGRVDSPLADGGTARVVCHPCRGRGHNGNTELARKVEVARRLLLRLEGGGG